MTKKEGIQYTSRPLPFLFAPPINTHGIIIYTHFGVYDKEERYTSHSLLFLASTINTHKILTHTLVAMFDQT